MSVQTLAATQPALLTPKADDCVDPLKVARAHPSD